MSIILHTDRLLFPNTQQITHNPRRYWLTQPFGARTGDVATIGLPGFEYDCNSNPKPLWWFTAPMVGKATAGTLKHDMDYACHYPDSSRASRKEADYWFWEIMRIYNVSWYRRHIKYRVVRGPGGWWSWRQKTPESIAWSRQFVKFVPIDDEDQILRVMKRGRVMADLFQLKLELWEPERIVAADKNILELASGRMDDELSDINVNDLVVKG